MNKLKILPVPFLIIAISLIAIFVQGTLLPIVSPVVFIPDFIIYSVIVLAVVRPNVYGVFLSFLCGFIFDLSQGILIGPWAGAYTILFVVLVVISRQIFFSKGFILFFVTALSALFTNSLYLLFTSFVPVQGQLTSSIALGGYSILYSLLLKALTTAIFSLFCVRYIIKLYALEEVSKI